DEDDVVALLAGLRVGVVSEAGRISADISRDHRRTRPFTPYFELVNRRCAERISGNQHHLLAGPDVLGGQLTNGGGLAGAIHPNGQDDVGLRGGIDLEWLGDGREDLLDLRGQHRAHLLWRNALVVATLLERICDASRRLKPEVCLNEQVLKLLQRAGVELALGKDACNAFGKFAGCLSQPRLEALEPARLWLRLLFRLSCFWLG